MTFGHFNRRLHLYLALLLLPWFLMYGVSSLPFSHPGPFQAAFDRGEWRTQSKRPLALDLPAGASLDEAGARIAASVGIGGDYRVSEPDSNTIRVAFPRFVGSVQATYSKPTQTLRVARRTFGLNEFLTGMHARGGFGGESVLSDVWAVAIDIVCLAMLVWIASGIYMWWGLRQTRRWGLVALGGGLLTFAGFLWGL